MINMVLHHPSFANYDLSSLRRILYGASPMPGPLIEVAMRRLPHVEFLQAYGMTETSPVLTVLGTRIIGEPGLRRRASRFWALKCASSMQSDRDVAAGECGEVIARGANIMKGYWNRPEITRRGAARGLDAYGRYRPASTGDGFLYILDRKKDMIKPGGENVYSPEVESMILGHPAVLEAAVIGVPHEKWGEAIRAVVVCRPGRCD